MKMTPRPRSRAAAMYFSTTPDCLTPRAAVGSSRIEHPGAEVDGAGDGHALALAAGEGADGLVQVVAGRCPCRAVRWSAVFFIRVDVETAHGPGALGHLGAEEEVAPDRHQRDGGEVLVDGGDAAGRGPRAGVVKRTGRAVDEELALGVLVQPGDDLDEGGLAGAVVAEHAGHLARRGRRGRRRAGRGCCRRTCRRRAVRRSGVAVRGGVRDDGAVGAACRGVMAVTSGSPCGGPTD